MNWVIGDVHGMYGPLRRLLEIVDAADPFAQFFFAGDYVNRGPDSRRVLDHLLSLTNARFVRGNHDDIFDLVLHGHCYAQQAAGGTPAAAYQWFIDYGLDRTFHSYGLDWDWLLQTASDPSAERMAHLSMVVPEEHKRFIRGLPPTIERETFFVAHGYWPPAQVCCPPSIEEVLHTDVEMRQPVLWGRFTLPEVDAEKPWAKPGFFGHTPVHTYYSDPRGAPIVPICGPRATLLDTGCALITWGRLTAYCVEEKRFLQVSHFGEVVKAALE